MDGHYLAHQYKPDIHYICMGRTGHEKIFCFFKKVIRIVSVQKLVRLHPGIFSSCYRERIYQSACCVCGTVISVRAAASV